MSDVVKRTKSNAAAAPSTHSLSSLSGVIVDIMMLLPGTSVTVSISSRKHELYVRLRIYMCNTAIVVSRTVQASRQRPAHYTAVIADFQ